MHILKKKSNPDLSILVYIYPTMYAAVIPEGAEYCLGSNGDIVANKMIVFSSEERFNRYLKKNKKE